MGGLSSSPSKEKKATLLPFRKFGKENGSSDDSGKPFLGYNETPSLIAKKDCAVVPDGSNPVTQRGRRKWEREENEERTACKENAGYLELDNDWVMSVPWAFSKIGRILMCDAGSGGKGGLSPASE